MRTSTSDSEPDDGISPPANDPSPGPSPHLVTHTLAVRPSRPPVSASAPNDPVITFLIKDLQCPIPNHTPLKVRYTQKFGPQLVAFCEQRNKRFRYDWNFVLWVPEPTADDPLHERGIIVKWDIRPCDFDQYGIPQLKMRDGTVIEVMLAADLRGEAAGGDEGGQGDNISEGTLSASEGSEDPAWQEVERLKWAYFQERHEKIRLEQENGLLRRELARLRYMLHSLHGDDTRTGSSDRDLE